MIKYSRQKFLEWLLKLPADQPFCVDHCCPINTYLMYLRAHRMRVPGSAVTVDREAALAIDEETHVQRRVAWRDLRPRDVIDVIDSLGAA